MQESVYTTDIFMSTEYTDMCVVASSSGQNTATNTVAVVQNLQVKHTTGNVPGRYASVCQQCFKPDSDES